MKSELYLFLLLLVGLLLRVYQISPALLERTVNRQFIDATITRELYRKDLPDLNLYLYGFPLYHYIVVVCYKLFGGINEVWGRLFSVTASILAAYWFYKLVFLYTSKRQALMALFFFYIVSPVNIILSRSFLVDELTLALGIGAFYYLSRWQNEKQLLQFLTGSLLTVLMLLSKITFGYLLLPILYLFKSNKERQVFIKTRWLIIFMLIIWFPTLIWYLYARDINRGLNQGSTGWDLFVWFSPIKLLSFHFYTNVFYHLLKYGVTPMGLVLGVGGLAMKQKNKACTFFYWWLASAIIFILIFNNASITHTYYFLAFCGPIAFFASRMSEWISNKFMPVLFIPKVMTILFMLLILSTVVTNQFLDDYRALLGHQNIPLVAGIVKAIVPANEKIVTTAYGSGGVIYFSEREGVELRMNNITSQEAIKALEKFKREGVKYYVIYNKIELANYSEFVNYLKIYKLIFETPDFNSIIYRL